MLPSVQSDSLVAFVQCFTHILAQNPKNLDQVTELLLKQWDMVMKKPLLQGRGNCIFHVLLFGRLLIDELELDPTSLSVISGPPPDSPNDLHYGLTITTKAYTVLIDTIFNRRAAKPHGKKAVTVTYVLSCFSTDLCRSNDSKFTWSEGVLRDSKNGVWTITKTTPWNERELKALAIQSLLHDDTLLLTRFKNVTVTCTWIKATLSFNQKRSDVVVSNLMALKAQEDLLLSKDIGVTIQAFDQLKECLGAIWTLGFNWNLRGVPADK